MWKGVIGIFPLALGAAAYGFAFGVVAAQLGFPWWGVGLMSGLVHAGSSQMIAVERFGSDGLIIGAVIAGAALNLRYLGIIASLSEVLREASWPVRLFAIHVTGDENWALTMATRKKDSTTDHRFLIGSGLVMISMWTLSTAIGALVGETVPNLENYGVGFAFTAAFVAMAYSLYRGANDLLPFFISFAATLLGSRLGLDSAFAIILGALAGLSTTAMFGYRLSMDD